MLTTKTNSLSRRWRVANLQTQLLGSHFLAVLLGGVFVLAFSRAYQTNFGDALEFLVAGLLSVVLMSASTGRIIVQPVKKLEQTMQAFAAGELNKRADSATIPELHHLGVTFNHLASSLQQVEQRRRDLVSDLLHELRTPLTALQGDLEMLQEGTRELTPALCAKLLRQIERLKQLAKDTQQLSKTEDGYLPMRFQAFPLQPLLRETLTMFAPDQFGSSCQVQLKCPDNLPKTYADPERVQQILVNLIGNAIAYTPAGTIKVRTWIGQDHLWIAIADSGIGIATEELPHIFERFWRSERARDVNPDGNGIGLAITKRLVELQGGQIEVASSLSQGTTFRFSLPLA